MLIVLLVGFIALCVWGCYDDGDVRAVLGAVGAVVTGAVIILMCKNASYAATIDSRIDVYSFENKRIETEMASIVEGYKTYERDVLTTLSPISLFATYPELKTNELVIAQMKLYTDNNQKILGLKIERENGSIYRWWLYFGR